MNMEHAKAVKAGVTAILATLTACWGWFGWLCIALAVCMATDYISGTWAAKKTKTWSSQVAREGLWHKLSIVISVLAAGILDIVLGTIVNNIPGLQLPFTYTVLFAPIVVLWYILTEIGSILENAGELGGPQPPWFKKAVDALKDTVDDKMNTGDGSTYDNDNGPYMDS